uniref:Plakophilin 4 n=1 Tax=Canis lupus familiaris TaxID=9615 RepID=A0A8I3S683_CANLF
MGRAGLPRPANGLRGGAGRGRRRADVPGSPGRAGRARWRPGGRRRRPLGSRGGSGAESGSTPAAQAAPWAPARGARGPPPPRGWWESRSGGGGGPPLGRGTFLISSGAAAATPRRGCPRARERRRAQPNRERGMPAPEQASLVEEGQPQTCQEAASTGPGMEPETTATTILASVKEQVFTSLSTLG